MMEMRSIATISQILEPLYTGKKELVCLCAKYVRTSLLIPYCCEQPRLPKPTRIFDICPYEYASGVDGIPVLPMSELKCVQADKVVILIAAEDQEFYQYLGLLYDELHCYYTPILPCTAIEAYFYAAGHSLEIQSTAEQFEDQKSKELYMSYWASRITGRVYDPALYTEHPYWGNDIISTLEPNSTIILGGAYNGLHIDRAFELTPHINALLFEPNPTWASFLQEKYCKASQIHVIPKALCHVNDKLFFDNTNELGAHICEADVSNCIVDTIRLDTLNLNNISEIALDIEGAELLALTGATETIRRCKPILAICAYHKISDYIEIPRMISSLGLNYHLHFRQHSCYYEESVIYAISS